MDEVYHSLAPEKGKNGKEQESPLSAFELLNTCFKLIALTTALRKQLRSWHRQQIFKNMVLKHSPGSVPQERGGRRDGSVHSPQTLMHIHRRKLALLLGVSKR